MGLQKNRGAALVQRRWRGVNGALIGPCPAWSFQSPIKRYQGLAMQICLTPRWWRGVRKTSGSSRNYTIK
jgi:hypothetical protein